MAGLEQAIAAIVKQGANVRDAVCSAVLDAAAGAWKGGGALSDVAGKVLAGALQAAGELAEERRGSVLSEVLDGLHDGLEKTAQCARLTLEEAASRGERFARQDLSRLGDDLAGVGHLLVQSVESAVRSSSTELRAGLGGLVEHAGRLAQSVGPSLEAAAQAARRDPISLAGETAGAGLDLARHSVGELFRLAAAGLQRAGEHLDPGSGGPKPQP